jgi:hypothetical protein
MVWGMTLPNGFGEFWPSGDFECLNKFEGGKWSKRLRLHYLEQTPDDQRRLYHCEGLSAGEVAATYPFYAMEKFTSEPGAVRKSLPLTPIQKHESPHSFDTEKGQKELGSLIMLNSKILAVDDVLKSVIDQLEPGVHQFYPIEIKMPRGILYPKQYYTLVIGQYFDAFSVDDSKPESISRHASGAIYKPFPSNGLAVRKAVFGNAHLWRDRSFGEELTCFSDELKVEIDKAGLRLPKHYKLKEV